MNTTDAATLRLAALIESSDDAIISQTLDGIIETWNRAAERMFGYTAGEALVKNAFTKNVLFTGSKAVGFQLIKWAAEADAEQQTHTRRVIAEMGGKNGRIESRVGGDGRQTFPVAGSAPSAGGHRTPCGRR